MTETASQFTLDDRLTNDTVVLGELAVCRLLLMNDDRWPWVILVPRINNAVEWHDLSEADQAMTFAETCRVANSLKQLTGCRKINTGSLGNVVSQLHIHVVARSPGDPNWPAPVWGFGQRICYSEQKLSETIHEMRALLIPDGTGFPK